MKIFDLMRPEEIYAKVLAQREVDGKNFYQKYNEKFIDVDCPSCGCKGREIFKKYGFIHKICENCRTLFCSPRPNDDLLLSYA
jgi:hypothetical protein